MRVVRAGSGNSELKSQLKALMYHMERLLKTEMKEATRHMKRKP